MKGLVREMTKEEFCLLGKKQFIYLDGATGSNLVKAGMPSGVCPEQWILEHKEVMKELQVAYADAGTQILYAPTFTTNRIKLGEYHLEDRQSEMIHELVGITRQVADAVTDRKVYVAGDLTMTGEQLRPMGTMELETLIDIYKEQIIHLQDAGVDLLVVETMMSLAETRAALIAAREVCDLPVMVTFTFESNGRTLFGTDAKTAAIVAESLGACAVGANCSSGPAQMRPVIEAMASVTRIPIIAKPNAGLPYLDAEGRTNYDMQPDKFAEEMEVLVQAGATVLGGCCGTAPEYINAIYEKFGEEFPVSLNNTAPENALAENDLDVTKPAQARVLRRPDGVRYLTSERMAVEFTLNGNFMIVGERINPTGKKLLQAQLREGSLEKVLQFAEEQEQCGACVLDVNMGMSGIDEKEMMLRAIEEISGVTNLPLSLDSSSVEVMEAALRHYPGRALINSVSLETEKFEKLLPLAAKYGAMFILLPLSDKGLPENLEEKKEIIHKIYEKALSLGMSREDIIVDGLVTTVGANRQAALETLETIRYCKELGFATICGLSNISFGMPERSYVNTAFLTLAIQNGLTMAIANPSQELLVSCALATDLLLARDEADIRYIEYANMVKENREKKEAELKQVLSAQQEVLRNTACNTSDKTCSDKIAMALDNTTNIKQLNENSGNQAAISTHSQNLYNAVLKGNRRGIVALTRTALEQGEEPTALLNDILLPAINEVGELFDKGKYFLPQLIASAEAMKLSIEILEPLMKRDTDAGDMPVVIIATVEGDIHDIGKNLVALMLKNNGFQVIDLGKDVPKEKIIEAAKAYNANFIALSALMTTTMQRMRDVIEYAKAEGVSAKIMIGGAVITQEYADEIGADGYSGDAADAVKLAKRLSRA